MKAVIELDVPEWQIGQPVTVYFPDTMQKQGICELPKEQPEIVRCKNCKHKEESVSPSWEAWCNRLHCGCDLDWFCADGEVKWE